MELVDELMTPGCPQCAYKHLSAALSYLADKCETVCAEHEILLARAKINLAECRMGYHKHFPFAIGLMERAETVAIATGYSAVAEIIRNVRVKLIAEGETMIPYSILAMTHGPCAVSIGSMMWAHIAEANREFRFDRVVEANEDSLLGALASIRIDYFDLPDEQPEKGGEEVMACGTKKAAPKKCCKAACKGGKCSAPKKGCKK